MRRYPAIRCTAALLACLPFAAEAQPTPFLGQIMCAAFNFPPTGWLRADGQLLPISQNQALFALLGTTYGGNGQTTFALPDLRGRVLLHDGQGAGLSNRVIGQTGGSESASLTVSNLPPHTHVVTPQGSNADATLISPANGVPSTKGRTTLYAPGPGTVAMSPTTSGATGGNQPVQTTPPYLTMNCFIAIQGVFPSRN